MTAHRRPQRRPRRRRKRRLPPGCLWIALGTLVTFCGGLTLFVVFLGITLGGRLEDQLSPRVMPKKTTNKAIEFEFFELESAHLVN